MTPDGKDVRFNIPTSATGPFSIVLGPDGNLWFTEMNTGQIGRFVP